MSDFDELLDREPMAVGIFRILRNMADRIHALESAQQPAPAEAPDLDEYYYKRLDAYMVEHKVQFISCQLAERFTKPAPAEAEDRRTSEVLWVERVWHDGSIGHLRAMAFQVRAEYERLFGKEAADG